MTENLHQKEHTGNGDFRSGDFCVEDKQRSGQPKIKFKDAELQALLDGGPCQTLSQLAKKLNITPMCVSKTFLHRKRVICGVLLLVIKSGFTLIIPSGRKRVWPLANHPL